ncbi:MAG TPA: DNA methyltransferase, partial [Candidatus Limnocylindrales bacterium]|nr:DNA methyltransferase [Candidatus Limnocylindrales bacterium]
MSPPIDAAPARSIAHSQLVVGLPELGLEPEWKAQPRLWGHSLHPMCSYLASFPAALAHAFVARYSRPGDVVLDPFSGRGTAPLEATSSGRIGIGNDLNPLAYLLTAAKLEPASAAESRTRSTMLRLQWNA